MSRRGVRNAYRPDRSYRWNYVHGPTFTGFALDDGPIPKTPAKDLFGFRVASRLGISAGILLNSNWVGAFSKQGFDILTYKTVRSSYRPCYPMPNWVYLQPDAGPLGTEDEPVRVAAARVRQRASDVTSAVCFGMPSMAPEVWRADVSEARRALRRDQLLIVSVVGTPDDGGGIDSLAEDYVRCARWAADAGAHIVEANFSCPNVCSAEGSVYHDSTTSAQLASALREALPSTPILLKAGYFSTPSKLRSFYRAVAPSVDGVVLVNGMTRRVLRQDGSPAFGKLERAGILGRAIHAEAVANVRQAVDIASEDGLELETMAVGGVLEPRDVHAFFETGARVVLTGGGAALDPSLARRCKREHPEW